MDQSKLTQHGDFGQAEDRPDCRKDLDHLRYENVETGETADFRCDQWDCACCGHRMKMNLLESIDRVLEDRPELSRLLTLTVDPSRVGSREVAHREIGEAWNRLRNYLQASYGDFSFIWVKEEQESGFPHIHALVSRYLPQSDVSEAWSRAGMGEVVDIRAVNARKAGHYIAKYLAKDAMAWMPSGTHRYGSSSDIELDVRGGSDGDGDSPWILLAYDDIVGGWVRAMAGDFIRDSGDSGKPPPC